MRVASAPVVRTRIRGRRFAALVLVVVVAACGATAPTGGPGVATAAPAGSATPVALPTPTSGATAPSAPTASPVPANPVSLPATPVGARLAWVLEVLNGRAPSLTEAELADVFAAGFLAQVPVGQLLPVLRQLAGAGPFTVTSFAPAAGDLQAEAQIQGTGGVAISVGIAVEPTAPNRISGLLFKPATGGPSPAPVASWEDVDSALADLAASPSLLAAEITSGRCAPIHALAADTSLAIGSTFKLYVLGELARQIEAGSAAWDEQLAIRDAWKSLPSGRMQDEPAGTQHSLQQFATQMISISDNTAADHLLHRVGREKVEAAMAALGLADPARNVPFLSARDMFVLKATRNAALSARYLAADAAGRRGLLDGEVASTPIALGDLADWAAPRAIDTLEWFASTADLCAAMAWLKDAGARPRLAPVLDVLAVNPGVQVDAARFPYVGYKGGSEPGVLQLTWLLRRADDRWFVLSMTLNDAADATDHTLAAVGVAQGALGLLAATP